MLKQVGAWFQKILSFGFKVGETEVTVGNLSMGILVLLITAAAARMADRALDRAPQLKIFDASAIGSVKRLVRYVIYVFGAAVALETVGFNLSTLFTAGAIFAVGFGLAMQNIAQNFVAGVILIAERSVRQNDVIMVEGVVVRVVEMGIRSTVARTRDDEEIIIPNSHLVQNPVRNYTLSDALYRVRSTVGVSYSSNMKQVREVLEEVAKGLSWRSKRKEPRILLLGFGTSSVDWEVSVWVSDPWDQPRALSRLNEAMWDGLAEAGITISFPQLDLHLDGPVEGALARLGAPAGNGSSERPTL